MVPQKKKGLADRLTWTECSFCVAASGAEVTDSRRRPGGWARARKYKLIALNLTNGTCSVFTVSLIESLLQGDCEAIAAQPDSVCSGAVK